MLPSGLLIAFTSVLVGTAIPGSGAMVQTPEGIEYGVSTPKQVEVSRALSQRGALFYGAWWCPACTAQKALFGREGAALLPYVECDRTDADRQRCLEAKVRAFPTWDLNGQRLEGVRSVEELSQWSRAAAGKTN